MRARSQTKTLTVKMFDAGTQPVYPDATDIPGCDRLYWREGTTWEENVASPRIAEQNFEMWDTLDLGSVSMDPWPETLPPVAWADFSSSNRAYGSDGVRPELYHNDPFTDPAAADWPLCPAGAGRLELNPEPTADPEEGRVTTTLDYLEIQAVQGPQWYRLETDNEHLGTRLKKPLLMVWARLTGPSYRLVMPDNSIYTPFDLRHGLDWYFLVDEHRARIPDELAEGLLDLANRGHYTLYLRPRRWRYVATVVAHFMYISFAWQFLAQEYFIRSHYDRPPFYPYRHNVITSSMSAPLTNYFGHARSYDLGIAWQWEHSYNATLLAREILNAQWKELCFAKLFVGNEDADITLWRQQPRRGEVVAGLGRLDTVTGDEHIAWIVQRVDLPSTTYQDQVLGQYLVPFRVDPDAPY